MAESNEYRPFALVGLAATGVITGALLGGLTNTINGLLSPNYFVRILGWYEVEDVWRASIAQGIFEGLLFGLLLGLVFATVVGCVSKARSNYGLGAEVLLRGAAGVLACWAIGGLLAMGLAALSPEFYHNAFRGVPRNFGEMLRYAWVGGSIWGIEFGGIALTILGSFFFYAKWQRRAIESQPGTPATNT